MFACIALFESRVIATLGDRDKEEFDDPFLQLSQFDPHVLVIVFFS